MYTVHARECAGVCTHVHSSRGQSRTLGVFLCYSPLYIFQTEFLTEWEAAILARLASQ